MQRCAVLVCFLALGGCQSPPEKRKQPDPDLWDPLHEAMLNQDEPPPERNEPQFTRASRTTGAGPTLMEAGEENTSGAADLAKSRAEHRRRVAAQEERTNSLHAREVRWVGRERKSSREGFAARRRGLLQAFLVQRPLGILLDQAYAHGVARGEPRGAIRFADRIAAVLSEEAQHRRAEVRKAQADAKIKARLHARGHGRPRASLRAHARAQSLELVALAAEEAAYRAAEAARRLRQASFGR